MRRLYTNHEALGVVLALTAAGACMTVLAAARGMILLALLAGTVAVAGSTAIIGWAKYLLTLRAAARAAAMTPEKVVAVRVRLGPTPAVVRAAAFLAIACAATLSITLVVTAASVRGGHGPVIIVVTMFVLGVGLLLAAALVLGARRLLCCGDPGTLQRIGVTLGGITAAAVGYGITNHPDDVGQLAAWVTVTALFGLLAWLPTAGQGRAWIQAHTRRPSAGTGAAWTDDGTASPSFDRSDSRGPTDPR